MVVKNAKGFTLIELLVVVAIIGILAAIAIPQFAAYRNQSFCSRVESDVKNAMTAAEAYYVENEAYPGGIGDVDFTPSEGVDIAFSGTGAAGDPFTVTATGQAADDCPKGDSLVYAQGSAPTWQ